MRKGIAVTAAVAAGLLLASCGNGRADSGTLGSSTSPTSATTTTTPGPASTTTTQTAPLVLPASGTGAYGYVTAGPTCPVEKQGQPCPPQPVSAGIDAHNASGVTVASTRSDSFGRYAINLAPGSYMLVFVIASGFPRCPDTPVVVQLGSATRADVSCDTGIR